MSVTKSLNMPLKILLVHNSSETIAEQICKQIELAISRGVLVAGDSMPSVRVLAVELQVNPNTVAKSLQLLVQRGSLVSQKGRGYFVAEVKQRVSNAEQKRLLKQAAEKFVASTRALALTNEELISAIETLLPKEKSDD